MKKSISILAVVAVVIFLPVLATALSGADNVGSASPNIKDTIVAEWAEVEAPPAPTLIPVKVEAATTALLILDIQNRNCNSERRPRCVASVGKIKGLLTKARAKGMPIVYSLTSSGQISDIRKEVAPLKSEPVVKSGVDKFFRTDLEGILKKMKVKRVILVGTSAHGAVLHTATGAALRGFEVVVAVDGSSAGSRYAEQYTAWHLVNGPGTRRRTTLTKISLIEF